MNFVIIMLVVRIINASNFSNYTDDYSSYYELCGEYDLFFEKPKTFPFTKPSCFWIQYSNLIYYEYIDFNKSTKQLSCRTFIKERCGLATSDIVLWVNKQEKNTIECIETVYKGYKYDYEDSCNVAKERPIFYLREDDLPFCSANYAYFASNFSSNLTLENPRNT